ncbi:MAG: hypothetical protein ACRD0F_04650 [Acidimicrobiales bacterium]
MNDVITTADAARARAQRYMVEGGFSLLPEENWTVLTCEVGWVARPVPPAGDNDRLGGVKLLVVPDGSVHSYPVIYKTADIVRDYRSRVAPPP